MQYKILESFHSVNLTIEVNDLIKEGWEPLGSVQVVTSGVQKENARYDNYNQVYVQSMIKKDEPGSFGPK